MALKGFNIGKNLAMQPFWSLLCPLENLPVNSACRQNLIKSALFVGFLLLTLAFLRANAGHAPRL